MRPSPRRISVAGAIPGEPDLALAADVFLPEGGGAPAAALFCFPGGGMHRGYFDLAAPGRSFARALTARGFAVVTIDSLGWGESGRPRDGFALVPEAIAAANAQSRSPRSRASSTRAGPGSRASASATRSARCSRSCSRPSTRASLRLVLLGAAHARPPRRCSPTRSSAYADRPEAARAAAGASSRGSAATARPGSSYPQLARAGAIFNGDADPAALAAMREVACEVVSVPALFSMIPGCSAPWAARVRVPVFLGIGERDITGPPHELPASFPRAPT